MRHSIKYILVLLLGIFMGKNMNTCKREKQLYALVEIERVEPLEVEVNGLPSGYDLVIKINFERGRGNVKPLDTSSALFCASETHARELAKTKECTHQLEKGVILAKRVRLCGIPYGVVSEMIACDFETAEEVMNFWASNDKSIKTLLDPKWTRVGCEKIGKYWVCVFG